MIPSGLLSSKDRMSVRVSGQVQHIEHTQDIVSFLFIPACLRDAVTLADLILPHPGILCLSKANSSLPWLVPKP